MTLKTGVLGLIVGAALIAIAPGARADTLADAATLIEQMLARGERAEAVTAARDLFRRITDAAGFGVTNARLTEAPASGFGVFEPRASNVYTLGDPVYAYVELYGFTLQQADDGESRMVFDVSFTLDDLEGRQMTDAMISMGAIELETHSQPVDGYFHLTYRITGATGPYVLRTEVVDRASGQRTQFTLPVEFVSPAARANPQRK